MECLYRTSPGAMFGCADPELRCVLPRAGYVLETAETGVKVRGQDHCYTHVVISYLLTVLRYTTNA